ncbi:hypothetical protein [Microbacterium sp. Marseille-Q6965]|uniref:hypothetical protein n=1 Tax=Microbacterium sp. Marseille-Q6965 TaxID=2965072 RepID=UPI0021B7C14B|nr:hypothetical protein [Microbacterium sp. Marseille-Q6965]
MTGREERSAEDGLGRDEQTRLVRRSGAGEDAPRDEATRAVRRGRRDVPAHDEATRVVARRADGIPPLDEATRVVARSAAPADPSVDDETRVVSRRADAVPPLDEATRVVARAAAPAASGVDEATRVTRSHAPAKATVDETTRVVARRADAIPPLDEATRVVARAAAPAHSDVDEATRVVTRRPDGAASPVDDATRVVARRADAIPPLDEATRVVARAAAEGTRAARRRRAESAGELHEGDATPAGDGLDESTRLVRRDALPDTAGGTNEETRIVPGRSGDSPLPDEGTRIVTRASPADDATRLTRRPAHRDEDGARVVPPPPRPDGPRVPDAAEDARPLVRPAGTGEQTAFEAPTTWTTTRTTTRVTAAPGWAPVPELDFRDDAAEAPRLIEDVPAPLRASGWDREPVAVRDVDAEAQQRAARRARGRRAAVVVGTMALVVTASASGLAALIATL